MCACCSKYDFLYQTSHYRKMSSLTFVIEFRVIDPLSLESMRLLKTASISSITMTLVTMKVMSRKTLRNTLHHAKKMHIRRTWSALFRTAASSPSLPAASRHIANSSSASLKSSRTRRSDPPTQRSRS
mmetsp:Transcript_15378/g.31485  ORF Transcript_15378/g.31485 Transcript_15378/m.31485 type:complete len:128 (+) Transcript_15378:715-1098(+)